MIRPTRLPRPRALSYTYHDTRSSNIAWLEIIYRRNRRPIRVLLGLSAALLLLWFLKAGTDMPVPEVNVKVHVGYEYGNPRGRELSRGVLGGAHGGHLVDLGRDSRGGPYRSEDAVKDAGVERERSIEDDESVRWAMDQERALRYEQERRGGAAAPIPNLQARPDQPIMPDAPKQPEQHHKLLEAQVKRPSWESEDDHIFRVWDPQQRMQHHPADSKGQQAMVEKQQPFQPGPDTQKALDAFENALPPPGMMQPSSPESFKPESVTKAELEPHTYLANGLLQVNPRGRHPIYDLIERAERNWADKLSSQSRTLSDAVTEYKRRYGRKPPRGFDKWWAYVQRHDVQLPDEYDQIMRDLEPFWGIRARDVRRAQAQARAKEGTFSIASSKSRGAVALSGLNLAKGEEEKRGLERAKEQLELLRGFGETWVDEATGKQTSVERELVAATGDWEITFNVHDIPRELVSWELDSERRARARAGLMVDPSWKAPSYPSLGWAAACPANSLLRLSYPPEPELPLPSKEPKTFIESHRPTMDPCAHPELMQLSGLFLGSGQRGPVMQETPSLMFGTTKTEGMYADILSVPVQGWVEDVEGDVEWEEKGDDRLLWRGSTTGVLFSPGVRWAASQRVRFMDMVSVHDRSLNQSVLLPQPAEAAVAEPEPRTQAWMNELLTDAAFVRGPVQCVQSECEALWSRYEFRSFMPEHHQNKYKYAFDIDGNGRSVRFHRLMRSKSLVLKSTVFPEWYSDRIQPWMHYVPVQLDLSDLYDILTFFRGDVADNGKGGHDELAKKIAYAGRDWAAKFWRKEDMVAYMWRLMLEYARVGNDARQYMDFDA